MNTEKFTGRAENYERFRPTYPDALLDYLYAQGNLTQASCIADVGAGTGKLSRLLAARGNFLFLVEPNGDMREVLAQNLGQAENVKIVGGSAEDTQLPDHSVDLITVAQAFHWFDPDKFAAECRRILTAKGKVAILYNGFGENTLMDEAKLITDEMMGISPVHEQNRRRNQHSFDSFFIAHVHHTFTMPGSTNLETFLGRMLSSSRAPLPEDERYAPYQAALKALFERLAPEGEYPLPTFTQCFMGEV